MARLSPCSPRGEPRAARLATDRNRRTTDPKWNDGPTALRTPARMRAWLLGLCWLGGAHGAVVQRVTGPDDSEITHASAGGGVNVYLTGSALGTPFNPRECPHSLTQPRHTSHANPLSARVCSVCAQPRSGWASREMRSALSRDSRARSPGCIASSTQLDCRRPRRTTRTSPFKTCLCEAATPFTTPGPTPSLRVGAHDSAPTNPRQRRSRRRPTSASTPALASPLSPTP